MSHHIRHVSVAIDRLFGTYRPRPAAGHLDMTLGLEDFREARELRFDRMLLQPFRHAPGGRLSRSV